MIHYLNNNQRQELLKAKQEKGYVFPTKEHRLLAYVNSAISPYDWTQIYSSIRLREKISDKNWMAVKGILMVMLVLTKRRNKESLKSVDAYVLDFIELMRSDRQGDPEKFLLNMKWYMPRFQFIVGLKVAFGLDWREIVTDTLKLKHKPQLETYGSLFVNKYLRTLLYAFICWKSYAEPGDTAFEIGVNDLSSLIDYYSGFYITVSREALQLLVVRLQESLPSYSSTIRARGAYAIDNALDGWYTINRKWEPNINYVQRKQK